MDLNDKSLWTLASEIYIFEAMPHLHHYLRDQMQALGPEAGSLQGPQRGMWRVGTVDMKDESLWAKLKSPKG